LNHRHENAQVVQFEAALDTFNFIHGSELLYQIGYRMIKP